MTVRITKAEKLAVECPKCGAEPGVPCADCRYAGGPGWHPSLKGFHKERREAALDAKRRRGEVTGDCYEAAGRHVTDAWLRGEAEGLTLVHGIVSGQGALAGQRIGHAWTEFESGIPMVRDVANGKNLVLPRALYYGEEDGRHTHDVGAMGRGKLQ